MAVIGKFSYSQTDNALTTAFVEYTFFERVKGFFVYNKANAGESTIEVSIDGTEENASVDPGDVVKIGNLVNSSITKVSLKYTSVGGSGAPDYKMGASEK
jgi:predicted lipoprotein